MIDDTATGVAKIVVDETDGTSYNGDVTFENGALLAPSFWGKGTPGTYTVMEWDGSVTNPQGLEFHEDVDTDVWSFNVDEANKRLTVTAQGTDLERTAVTVDSIEELRHYLDREYHDITMAPGTYWMTGPTTRPAASDEGGRFLDFRGEHSKYVFTDVHIKVDTQELHGYGSDYNLKIFHVTGDYIEVDGLTLSMEKLTLRGKDVFGLDKEWHHGSGACTLVKVIGSNTTIKNCEFTTGGSYPYGYGDVFGKGARKYDDSPFIQPKKMSGFLITEGASDVKVENVTLNMKSFGHGFFLQLGAKDIEYINCTILGDDMADSDDIIAHPLYQKWGFTTHKTALPTDIRISKHEGGFRSYSNPDWETNGYPEYLQNITIDNCRIERMRTGIALGSDTGYLRVSNTEVYECEYGFSPSDLASENTFTDCKGDALNGPLIHFKKSVDDIEDMEIELTGDCPGKGIWPIAKISGNNNVITLTSSAKPGVYSKGAYVNLAQNWRQWRYRPPSDIDDVEASTSENKILNYTDQILVFGKNATDNTDCVSWGPVIDKGSDNEYDGSDLVSGPIVVHDTWTGPPWNVPWAHFSGGVQTVPTLPYTVYEGLPVYYSDNYPVYALGVPITPNSPAWTTTNSPISYTRPSNFPDDLGLDTSTGVISGTPTAVSAATDYTVQAFYSANIYATVDLRITVNDVVAILLEGTTGVSQMRVTFNGSGSWVTAGSTVETFKIGHDEVANSSHGSLNNETKEGIRDVLITGGTGDNPMNAALSGNYPRGQYVALNPAIEMTADVCKSPFNVIGLLFDDDEGTGKDDIVLVTDQPENTTTWPAGTKITYTVGATARFSLDSDIEAHFDDAFNKGTYTLDDGLVGSLKIAATVIPSGLDYGTTTLTFTLGEDITSIEPTTSGGSAVDSYSISPALPAGLEFDLATGEISGTPTVWSAATDYTVTATNTAGSSSPVTLNIIVNDVVAILLEGTEDVYKMRVTFNRTETETGTGITGSWVTAAGTASAFAHGDSNVANSSDASLGGSGKEGFRDVEITGGDPMNAALNGNDYSDGQYVALDTSIEMTADEDPSPFNVIGLLFDDNEGAGTDRIVLVTDQPENTTTWPAGTKITYTVGATARFSLDSDIEAHFDDAFNKGTYTLDDGLVGSLKIAATVIPSGLDYGTTTLTFTLGEDITSIEPTTSGGSAVDTYAIDPALPAGLNFNTTTGVISGTPTVWNAATTYTVTATNTAGSSSPVTLNIIVNDVVAILLEGTEDVYKMRVTFNRTETETGTGITGSWVTAAGTASAFAHGDSNVANSSDASLGGSGKEGFRDVEITGGDPMNAALNGNDYSDGQYVALDTSIEMTADEDPSPFNVIGLLFDDDEGTGKDDIVLVTDQPENTTTWPAGTKITYTVGATARFSLDSDIEAHFDDAFNKGTYTLDDGLVGSLKIAATVIPSGLDYGTTTLTFTLGEDITSIEPTTSGGSAVDSYSISPALPAGLEFDLATGEISGTPTVWSAATDYTVTATNTAGSSSPVTLNIIVNDVVAILLEGTEDVYKMRVTFNRTETETGTGITGSWVTAAGTASAFAHGDSNVANSSDASLGGSGKEGFRDVEITGGDPMNAALNGNDYSDGQYVALDTSIEMTADEDPSPFNVIGLLFDDNEGAGTDRIVLVTDQPENTTTWPAGTKITYTVGATARFSLDSDIEAHFDDAFNKGTYTLDDGLVGSLKIAATVIPSGLDYGTTTLTFTLGEDITSIEPTTSGGSAVDTYAIDPALPDGLDFDTTTGEISGTPTVWNAATTYTVTATNTAGSSSPVTLNIIVNDVVAILLEGTEDVYKMRVTFNRTETETGTGITGSWVTAAGTASAFAHGDSNVANSSDASLGGSGKEGFRDVEITGGDPMNAALNGNDYSDGQYVALDTSIEMTADEDPSPFNVIGLLFDDNEGAGTDRIVLVTDQPENTTTWPAGTKITYTVGATARFSLDSDIEAHFDDAFNKGTYTLDDGLVGSLKIAATVIPSGLDYGTTTLTFTLGEDITSIEPTTSGGSAVDTYAIDPALPDGLDFDTTTGEISGTPTVWNAATTYTVTATNTAGSSTPVTLNITVNDVVAILLEGTTGVSQMRVTFNGETGSWVTAADTASAFTHADTQVANSSDPSLNNDQGNGETKEGFRDVEITGGDPMNADLSVGFTDGQYVALDTSITMIPDGDQTSSFEVIGLLFNDDNDTDTGEDQIVLVTDQPDTSSWPAGTKISYTVGASATFSLDSDIEAHFDDAFNKGTYTLDDGLVGSLKIAATVIPSGLDYGTTTLTFTLGEDITSIEPTTSGGSAVDTYAIDPALPAGLNFNTTTGVISGTPTVWNAATTYTVTATNTAGSSSPVTLNIIVNDVVAILLEGTEDVYKMRVTFNRTETETGTGITGSWVTAAGTASAFAHGDSNVANSSDASLGGSGKEGFRDVEITGGDPMNAALNGNDYSDGQYVALDTSIEMTADEDPSPFNVIGLLFDDNEGAGTDRIVLVTDQPENTTTWPAGTKITYTVGATARFSLDSDIEAHFDDAFNKGTYTLDDGLVGSLKIAATVIPSGLDYGTTTLTFTLGEDITSIEPTTSGGSAVDTYAIDPALPAGLDFDTTTGEISGTPTVWNAATTYTVTATNTAGSSSPVTLNIIVNDVVAILLEGTEDVYKMRVTFNRTETETGTGITGSWVTAAGTASAFAHGDSNVANSSDASLGGSGKEGFRDVEITGGDPMNAALNGNDYSDGQYVALDTSIEMTADEDPSPFNVIGLLFDDNEGAGTDRIVLVTDQPENTTTWPAGTKISYTVGASARFSLDSDIEAHFDDAFNKGTYTLDDGLVGSLKIAATVIPSGLDYGTTTLTFTLGEDITSIEPTTSGGSAVDTYAIDPALPAGLNFNTTTGEISGTPTVWNAATTYTVTATNTAGSSSPVTLNIIVNDVVAILLEGTEDVYKMRVTFNRTETETGTGITGSWVTAAGTASAFAHGDSNVANSSDASLGGSGKEGFRDVEITGGDPMNAALNGNDYSDGQYVALDTSIEMTADEDPSPFNVIGLLFDDNEGAGTDRIVLVTDQPENTTTWPAGTKITYTVGATARFSLDSDIEAHFDDAFNKGTYTLDDGLVGSLKIAATVIPSGLDYGTTTLTFTLGEDITSIEPTTSGGSAVDSYSISPALPAGLEFDLATGEISGTPTVWSAATDYTVTATNTAGSSSPVTLNITVNDVVVLLLEGTTGVSQMRVTFNGETGSWVTAADTASAFTHADTQVANSSDPSLNNDQGNGETKEGFRDVEITGGDPMNADLSVGFTDGQYVALDTSITMIPDGDQTSSFEVIGLLFNDDNDTDTGEDQIVLVTDQPDTSSWPAGTKISYTVGASATFSLDSDIEAHFDDAFNKGTYTLDDGLVGSLKIAATVIPSGLDYGTTTLTFTLGEDITSIEPTTSGGSAVDTYAIDPALPAGLNFNTTTGVISGTPTVWNAATTYTVTATNTAGSSSPVTLNIIVNDVVAILLEGTEDVYKMRVTFNRTETETGTGITGSWVTAAGTASAFAHDDSNVANSSDASLGGSGKEGFRDVEITGGDPMNAALNGNDYSDGQYVALDTSIEMTADEDPSPFNVIGLLFDDNEGAGTDRIVLVTDQPENTTTWPAGTKITYTVGASATFSLDSDIEAHFDDAFNKGTYTLDDGLVGSLKIAATVIPSGLDYGTTTLTFTLGEDITSIEPTTSGGSAVDTYAIDPALPAGLNFNTTTGVISGTPTVWNAATTYTVTATNTAGSSSPVTLNIIVNDVVAILLEGTEDVYKMRVTFNRTETETGTGITGSWVTAAGTASAFAHGDSNVANSSDASLGGSGKEGFRDVEITGGDPMNAALNGNDYSDGQYVALDTSIEMTADEDPSPFNVIGLLFDDNEGAGTDRIVLVTDQPENTTTWPAGTKITYTVGATARFSLDSDIEAHFDDAFNKGTYTLDDGLVGSLKIAATVIPSGLDYGTTTLTFTLGEDITSIEPTTSGGSAVDTYAIDPALPAGLNFNTTTGEISGTPTVWNAATTYTVTATNTAGSSSPVTLNIIVNDVVAILLEGTEDVYKMRVTFNRTETETGTGITGSWVTATGTASAFAHGDSNVANSSDASLGGSGKEGFRDVEITGGDPMNAALNGNDYSDGQYVALDTSIEMTADEDPSPFNVIGLLFDDNEGAGTDRIVLVTDQPENTTTWPAGTKITYTVGATARFSLDSDIEAHFDDAFNKGTYTLDDGLVGSLKIAATVIPSGLDYGTTTLTFTLGEDITSIEPTTSGGSAVDSYSISPALPAGLEFDLATGEISGTPTVWSAATDYTVTATNTAGSSSPVTLNIIVNDVVVLLLEGTTGVSQMRVTFNGTGSWVMKSDSDTSFSFGSSQVANSSNASLGGSSKEALQNVQISGGNPMNVALSGSFENGQYVALATPIAMTGDDGAGRFSFNVIGLLFDDDSTDSTPNGDDIVLVTDQPDTSSWTSYFTEIFYTVGASTTFSLDSGIGATFDEAFNKGSYTLDEGLVGSLKIANPVIPSNLQYTKSGEETPTLTLTFTRGVFAEYLPSSGGSAVDSYEIDTALPDGLRLQETGVISGTPTVWSPATTYTVTAENTTGEDDVTLTITVKLPLITVNDGAPSALSYTTNPAIYTKGLAIADNSPSSRGGNVAYYWITPALPSGLSFDRYTGVISGTPTELSPATDYTVRATNTAGWDEVTLEITVFGKDLQEWRQAHFANMEDPDMQAMEWGNMADPDGDGWINAFEFFFGTDPQSLDMNSPMRYEFVEEEADRFAVWEFERSKAAPAEAGVVQYASDLSQWQTVSAPAVVVEDLGDRELVRVSMRLEQQATRHFMRLALDLEMF